jgi:hypothetical protein
MAYGQPLLLFYHSAAGVVIFGAIIAVARMLSTSTDLVEDFIARTPSAAW